MSEDGRKSYALAQAAIREARIRDGDIPPHETINETEKRWAAEGHRPWPELETVKCATPSSSSS